MRTKLLFTATLMAATGMVSHNVHAKQGFASVTSVSTTVVAEGEDVEAEPVSDDFTDYTSYVKNASCTVDDRTTWTRNTLNGNDNQYWATNEVLNSDVFSGAGIEFYRDDALHNQDLIWQVVRGLPAGTYNVTAYAAGRNTKAEDINNKDLFLFAGDKQVQVTDIKWAEYTIEGVEVGADGVLKIGLHGGAENGSNWVLIADVRLVYVNNKASLDLAITKATAINVVYNDTNLSEAITTAQGIGEGETSTAYKTAIGNLNQAMDDALVENVTPEKPYQLYTIANDFSGVVPNGWLSVNGSFGRLALENDNKATEYYHQAFEVKQELKNLRNGKYKVSVQAISQDTKDFYIYAQGDGDATQIEKHVTENAKPEGDGNIFQKTVNYMMAHPTEQLVEIETNVINGSLTVGMRAGGNNWMVVNDFKLECLEFSTLEKIKKLYLEKVGLCNKLAESLKGKIPAACLTELNKDEEEYTTEEEYTQAIEKAYNMMFLANSMVAPYQGYVDLRTKIQKDFENTTNTDENKETLTNAIADNNAKLDVAMTVEGIDAARVALLGVYQTYLENAVPTTVGYSIDLTFRLQNPTCAEYYGWEKFEGNISAGYNVDLDDRRGVETWVNSGTARKNMNLIWQTVDGLQPGKYTFKAYAVGRDQTRSGEPYNGSLYLFANDNVTEVNGRVWTESSVECLVLEDGKLTLGISAGADNENNWNAITGATLIYNGHAGKTDTEWMADVLDAKNVEAEGYLTKHADINGKYKELLTQKATMADDATVEDYRTAIAEKNEQMKNAYLIVDSYKEYSALRQRCDNFFNNSPLSSEWAEKADLVKKNVEATTEIDEVRKGTQELKKIRNEIVDNAAQNSEDFVFDVTGLFVQNPDPTTLSVHRPLTDFGWNSEVGGNRQTNNSTNDDSKGVEFYETWNGGDAIENGRWAIYQDVTLPAGNYKLTAEAFWGKTNQATEMNGALCAGDVYSENITSHDASNLSSVGLDFNQSAEEGTVRVGLRATAGNGSNWCGFRNIKIEWVASNLVLLNEADETDMVENKEKACVKMSRVLGYGKWNTFCVPFDMTAAQLADNGITEVRELSDATKGTSHATLKFTKVEAVEAGKPYIIKVSAPVSEIKVSGVSLQSAMHDISLASGITMKGNYAKGNVPDGAFFISDNAFYLADTEESETKVTLKGFRAYIESPETNGGELNRMLIDLDGVVTSVEETLGSEVSQENSKVDVYSLSGVKLKVGVEKGEALEGLPRGIYVIEGRKVMK